MARSTAARIVFLTIKEETFMFKFVAGMLVGLILGVTATAYAAQVIGSGSLNGWTVTKDGEEVCSDPDVDVGAKEIECD